MPIMKPLTGLVAAAAIAMTGMAQPAQAATNQDLQRLLMGAAGVAALGYILHQGKRNQAQAQPAPGRPAHSYRGEVLPAQCASEERTRNGWQTFYDPYCLTRSGLRNLPAWCEVRITDHRNARRDVFDGACLQQAGYEPERGRHR